MELRQCHYIRLSNRVSRPSPGDMDGWIARSSCMWAIVETTTKLAHPKRAVYTFESFDRFISLSKNGVHCRKCDGDRMGWPSDSMFKIKKEAEMRILNVLRAGVVFGMAVIGTKSIADTTAKEVSGEWFAYSFTSEPYIHPLFMQCLSSFQTEYTLKVGVRLARSEKGVRRVGKVDVYKVEGLNPHVSVETRTIEPDEVLGSFESYESFGYRYFGKTSSGIHVLETNNCMGGTGNFISLIFVDIQSDPADASRILLRQLGEFYLGDRYDGKIEVRGDEVLVGKDIGGQGEGVSGRRDSANELKIWKELGIRIQKEPPKSRRQGEAVIAREALKQHEVRIKKVPPNEPTE